MANIPHIVYATDDNFAEILGVSLVSLYENSKDVDDIIVYVLDSGISDENIKKLKSLPKKYSRSDLSFIKATDISKELSMNVNLDRGSLSQYARLFVSSVLPCILDRVLYLDCDIIINKSISELWNLDIKGKTIAALKDAFSKQYRKNIDLEPDDIMFNSYPFDYEDFGYQQPYVREYLKIGRNDPCPCGSGKKYKKCCGKDK